MAPASKTATSGATAAGLTVTQVKSSIGSKPKHRGTLRALGLHGIGTTNTLPDRPEIRGMIARVPHLISVEETAAGGDSGGKEKQ
ncbi:MAG TPA: 50S ribosomal protein L30 [Acidimicrobiales bacterium]|nr:50S ribosomal protein L30 [Acidimicrobiales bacterium]